MKKRILITLILFSVFRFNSFSQVKTIKDPSGRILAFECFNGNIKLAETQPALTLIDSLGTVDTLINQNIELVNVNSNVVISMQDSLTIVDPGGNLIAVYDPVLKRLTAADGDLVFTLNESNVVYNSGGVVVGWIDETGSIYANDSNQIADAPGIEPFKLAYYFFYNIR